MPINPIIIITTIPRSANKSGCCDNQSNQLVDWVGLVSSIDSLTLFWEDKVISSFLVVELDDESSPDSEGSDGGSIVCTIIPRLTLFVIEADYVFFYYYTRNRPDCNQKAWIYV